MARVAAIDIGTNTVLLLVLETSQGGVRALVERATITRLGQGVDRSRRLSPDAQARTLACLADYASAIRSAGVTRLAAVGTSALRDADGGPAFLDEATRVLGVRPRVIEGKEEAALTFSGALSGLDVDGEVVVFDVGGGSTEIVVGSRDRGVPCARLARSLDVGSVRLFERHIESDPPLAIELDRVRADVRSALATLPHASGAATLIGVAGTVTTLAAIDQGQASYDADRVHGARLSSAALSRLVARLAATSLSERRGIPGLEPGRADVIVVGGLIVEQVLEWSGAAELVVSDRGVRWGLALELATTLGRPAI